MKKTPIITSYEGQEINFTDHGWFNATQAAAKFGKRPIDWLRLPEIERYIDALCRKSDVRKSHFTMTRKGNSKNFTQGTWLHPKLAVRFSQWLDIDFSIWCDEQIDQIIRGKHPVFDVYLLRHAAAASFKVLMDILKASREQQGKETERHHYINEALMMNEVLTGVRESVDRDSLTKPYLDLLCKIEMQNAVLIGSQMPYEARKSTLQTFATLYRAKAIAANDYAVLHSGVAS